MGTPRSANLGMCLNFTNSIPSDYHKQMLIEMPTLAEISGILAAGLLETWIPWLWMILQVAIGLGFIIFVHELGHFAVAKWCGVRCDKFMVGFDINGWKISKQIGETEYGIGILPLGGYVKMYGQEDNVANIAKRWSGPRP